MPRKYVQRISPDEKSAIMRENAAKRYGGAFPPREKRKALFIPEYIYDALNAKRGRRTWPSFLAAVAGLPPRPNKRKTGKNNP